MIAPEAKAIWGLELVGYVNPTPSASNGGSQSTVVVSKVKTDYYSQPIWRVK